ncbi:hypothetical protein ZOSMA_45G00710 [Zostera marina]|uniref:Uncharacterized protein n=1 Tax=Zostera marina TaxID=29655 RepID=A0A0K9P2T9_ZOSMR|nr:hypothetical protein ZOSMA_45G00710 [Zostera marina]
MGLFAEYTYYKTFALNYVSPFVCGASPQRSSHCTPHMAGCIIKN